MYVSTGDSIRPFPKPSNVIPMNMCGTDVAKNRSGHAIKCGIVTTYIARFRPKGPASIPVKRDPIACAMSTILPARKIIMLLWGEHLEHFDIIYLTRILVIH